MGAGAVAVRRLWRGAAGPVDADTWQEPLWRHVRVGLIVAVMAALLHLDALVVRVFLPPDVAADYVRLAVIGRLVYWVSVTIGVVLLPHVVQAATRGEDHVRAYLISVGLMALVGSLTALHVLLAPEWSFGIAFGDDHMPNTELLPLYVGAAAMLAVATMTATLHIGVSNLRVWAPLAGLLAATLIACGVANDSARQVVTVILVADAVAMVYLVGEAAWLVRRKPAPA